MVGPDGCQGPPVPRLRTATADAGQSGAKPPAFHGPLPHDHPGDGTRVLPAPGSPGCCPTFERLERALATGRVAVEYNRTYILDKSKSDS